MKKRFAVLFAAGSAIAMPSMAQSNVTLYGLLDTTIRYTTNENAAGSGKVQMGDGVLTGSRWGLHGTEDLGGGTKALFVIESGFGPDTGVSQQGGRLFGRKAYLGLQGNFGAVTLGRQFTVMHEVSPATTPWRSPRCRWSASRAARTRAVCARTICSSTPASSAT